MFESPKKQVAQSKQNLQARALVCPVMHEQYYNIWTQDIDSLLIKHEASLMGHQPILSPGLPAAIVMQYRILTFGVGSTNDVPLDRFGYCNYTSPKHAVVFYDIIKKKKIKTKIENIVDKEIYCRCKNKRAITLIQMIKFDLLTKNEIEKINKMFESPKKQVAQSKQNLQARALVCPVMHEQYYNIWTQDIDSLLIKHEASLMGHQPILSPGLPAAIVMQYRILTFGVGSTNDVPLDRFGYCNYTSPKHAVVFYDIIKKRYELLNYSCYGTYVNNTLAANNEICHKNKKSKRNHYEEDKDLSIERTQISSVSPERRTRMTPLRKSFIKKGIRKCGCTPSNFERLTAGWEGSVNVPCGSVLRFGCLSFIFSITNFLNE
ncbi:hypothetical protein FQA39_LY03884 [Lamprigera yunnana]|nr:hypothetical protein FQA39_LY03884 [Lamprigera yunnana]